MSAQQCVECGAVATCERVIVGLVAHLCADHAAEVDRGTEEEDEMANKYRVEALKAEAEAGEQPWVLAPIHGERMFAPPPAEGLSLPEACVQALLPSRGGLARVVDESTGLALTSEQLRAVQS